MQAEYFIRRMISKWVKEWCRQKSLALQLKPHECQMSCLTAVLRRRTYLYTHANACIHTPTHQHLRTDLVGILRIGLRGFSPSPKVSLSTFRRKNIFYIQNKKFCTLCQKINYKYQIPNKPDNNNYIQSLSKLKCSINFFITNIFIIK